MTKDEELESRRNNKETTYSDPEAGADIGATIGCKKFLGVVSNDQADRFVHHSESGRDRMEKLMREDDKYHTQVESAERRQVERFADTLERRALEKTKKAEANDFIQEQTKRRRIRTMWYKQWRRIMRFALLECALCGAASSSQRSVSAS